MIKKYLCFFIVVLITLLLFFFSRINFNDSKEELLEEEVIPIWNEDRIESFDYEIKIEKNKKKKTIIVPTAIIESVLHYKDIRMIDRVNVNIKIKNESNNQYMINNIYLIDERFNKIVEELSYTTREDKTVLLLEKDFFDYYHPSFKIYLELKK